MSRGILYIAGIGPGKPDQMSMRCRLILEECEVVVGYHVYTELIEELTGDKKVLSYGMTGEVERCRKAVELASEGRVTVLVCSGDPGVYGMAGLAIELSEELAADIDLEVVPGITAATSAAAVLGAPLIHDFAVISLSDRLTSMDLIEKRLALAAEGDFVIVLYNPRSRGRQKHLERAVEIIGRHRRLETPAGIVWNAGRDGECKEITTLERACSFDVDMFATVIVGNSDTCVKGGKMVTPRGYRI